jgi:hypothetical protein
LQRFHFWFRISKEGKIWLFRKSWERREHRVIYRNSRSNSSTGCKCYNHLSLISQHPRWTENSKIEKCPKVVTLVFCLVSTSLNDFLFCWQDPIVCRIEFEINNTKNLVSTFEFPACNSKTVQYKKYVHSTWIVELPRATVIHEWLSIPAVYLSLWISAKSKIASTRALEWLSCVIKPWLGSHSKTILSPMPLQMVVTPTGFIHSFIHSLSQSNTVL